MQLQMQKVNLIALRKNFMDLSITLGALNKILTAFALRYI